MIDSEAIRRRFASLSPHLDERSRRLFAASEAKACGHGGIVAVAAATGIAPSTIGRGLKELACTVKLEAGRVRQPGGGRKRLADIDKALIDDLLALVEPDARGDPMSPLRWTTKSLRHLGRELVARGHQISYTVVGELLKMLNFSLQGNRKTKEGGDHPDRNAQFAHLNHSVENALAEGQPVISIDTKKKELVGEFKNNGKDWRPQGQPEEVRVHDFVDKELGRAVPYGIYDVAANAGWVSVGMNNDTSTFAVNSLRRWWTEVGCIRYPDAKCLVITADGGGSNSSRGRLWKLELQKLADELKIDIKIHHLPPGTSKWNKIEHKLFSFITMNWRAHPLVTYCVIISLIAATTTKTGLTVRCELDETKYTKGIVVSDQEMDGINIIRDAFHGEWNYTIKPRILKIDAVDS
jgi:hypothetical protein